MLAGCGGSDDAPTPVVPNIVRLAQATPSLRILVKAVVAADLVATLSGPGPFTVFAPNNDAFGALLAELKVTKAVLLADKPLLMAVLTYHVLGGKVEKAGIPLGKTLTLLQKSVFKIGAPGGVLTITDGRNRTSKILATDVQASNGVVHIIDKVILPANLDIVQTAQSISDFTTLVSAVIAAELVTTLKSAGPFTVFAPSNTAFTASLAAIGVTAVGDLLLPANKAVLTSILKYHVVSGQVLKADIVPATAIKTVQGDTFSISPALAITDQRGRTADITATDVFATNGVIHVIDKVILPKA